MEKLTLSGRLVGPGEPPYVIAEIGSNHNGDMELAKRLIDAATGCGADAVKFQSWSITSLISKAEYARNTKYTDKRKHFGTLEEMVERYRLTPEQHLELADYCAQRGICFLSSCFSPEEVDLLESLGVPAFKIASMDINYIGFLEYIARKGRQVILSTGMATLGEIEKAVDTLRENGSGPIALLHCVSVYPPAHETINLRNIPTLQYTFDVPVGFSDHTLGTAIPLAAIALGSCIIEKHFTTDKGMEGWDHAISADPEEMATICHEGLNVFAALGHGTRIVSQDELKRRRAFRRRLVARRTLRKGDIFSADDGNFKRPGNGIHPHELPYVIGRVLTRDIEEDGEIEWTDFL
jgi:N,N'-diacetyllegionaminate synthase